MIRPSTAHRTSSPAISTNNKRPLSIWCSTTTTLVILLALFALLPPVTAAPNCLRFADHNSINQAFTDGGPGHKVLLCPSKTYRLSGTIVFTAADQELSTYGSPTGVERAKLVVSGEISTLIQGDCRRYARVSITSLIIDGGRSKLGRIIQNDQSLGLIVLGGNEGPVVKHCAISHPRGFTAIHVREGDKVSCTGAMIEKNEIGPVGEEYDPVKDGGDPEMSSLGRPLADGISIACRDSFIRDNTFIDNTDAAIVLYCSPGTLVQANRITTKTLSAMAGILMVDSTPFDGDYSGTIIKSNTIDAANKIIRVGIGIGPPVWSDDIDTVLKGGSVIGNGLKGGFMGFGIAAAGLEGWTIKDNWDEARHVGVKSARCFEDSENPEPVAFLQNSKLIKDSEVQSGFVDQPFEYVVCIDGPEHAAVIPEKSDVQAKAVIAVAQPDVPAEFNTGSTVLDDILEHSQQRMMEAIEHLARRVDILASSGRSEKSGQTLDGGQGLTAEVADALVDLAERVEAIEKRQNALLETTAKMRSLLQTYDRDMAATHEWQYEVLLDVQNRLNRYLSPTSPPVSLTSKKKPVGLPLSLSNRARLASSSTGGLGLWGMLWKCVLGLGVLGGGWILAKKLLRRRRRSKIAKD